MTVRWLRVGRDIVIYTVLAFIAGILEWVLGKITGVDPQVLLNLLDPFVGIVAFIYFSYSVIGNRWLHLGIVALGIWILGFIVDHSLLGTLFNTLDVAAQLVVGGAIGAFLRNRNQLSRQS